MYKTEMIHYLELLREINEITYTNYPLSNSNNLSTLVMIKMIASPHLLLPFPMALYPRRPTVMDLINELLFLWLLVVSGQREVSVGDAIVGRKGPGGIYSQCSLCYPAG